jgi:hypothetical protein
MADQIGWRALNHQFLSALCRTADDLRADSASIDLQAANKASIDRQVDKVGFSDGAVPDSDGDFEPKNLPDDGAGDPAGGDSATVGQTSDQSWAEWYAVHWPDGWFGILHKGLTAALATAFLAILALLTILAIVACTKSSKESSIALPRVYT